MAFNKDPAGMAAVGSYGGGNFMQNARTQARRPSGGGGGGGAPYWKDNYKAPPVVADTIRLVSAEYVVEVTYDNENIVQETLPYFPWTEHHDGKRGCVCCAGALFASKKGAKYCPSCTLFWEDVRARADKKKSGDKTTGPNRMSARKQYAFNVWDYGLYFQMPDLDRNKQPRMDKNGNPYTHWEKGDANDPQYHGKPWKQGDLRAFPMGETYKETFVEWGKRVGECCKSCGNRDCIRTIMKICGNQACGAPVYDPNTAQLTQEQRDQIDYYPHTCAHCKEEKFVAEVIECACGNGQRATIFDVDFQIQRIGTGAQTMLQIFAFSNPRPIQVADPEVLATIVPLDLPKKFAPTSPETQSKIYGIPNTPPLEGPANPAPGAPPPMQQGQPPQAQQPPPQQYGAPPQAGYGAPAPQAPAPQPQQYQPPGGGMAPPPQATYGAPAQEQPALYGVAAPPQYQPPPQQQQQQQYGAPAMQQPQPMAVPGQQQQPAPSQPAQPPGVMDAATAAASNMPAGTVPYAPPSGGYTPQQ